MTISRDPRPGAEPLDTSAPPRAPAVDGVSEGLPGIVGYWDRELRNRVANDGYVEWFGRTPQQVRGVHLREVLGARNFEASLPSVRRALAGKEQLVDWSLVDGKGRTRFVQASYIRDDRDGEVLGLFSVMADVTVRVVAERGLQESVEQYRALARSMPSGFVLLFDGDLRFTVADGVELATFGYTRRGLEGRTVFEVFPADLVRELQPRYRAALAGRSSSWERTIGHRTFKLTAGPVVPDQGTIASGMVTAFDITDERRNEQTWTALHAIATDVARRAGPEEIADHIAQALVQIFAVDTSAVIRYTGRRTAEILTMAPQQLPTLSDKLEFAAGDASALARVFEPGGPV